MIVWEVEKNAGLMSAHEHANGAFEVTVYMQTGWAETLRSCDEGLSCVEIRGLRPPIGLVIPGTEHRGAVH
jgi:hypothetical protein